MPRKGKVAVPPWSAVRWPRVFSSSPSSGHLSYSVLFLTGPSLCHPHRVHSMVGTSPASPEATSSLGGINSPSFRVLYFSAPSRKIGLVGR